ncbi:heme-binding protein [Alteromonas oceani]|uniref:Heme-binding protein n=1 Tax=Alteromonas oceani TaxID=2071609 RepID=A0ABV7K1K7_9ALTE|nr:heme-binding protein [Alteromonas oceani]
MTTSMTLAAARRHIADAISKSEQLGIKVCIAIVDSGAHLVAFERMDGAFLGSVDIAIKKARTSALFPLESGQLGALIRSEQLTGFESSNENLMGFNGGVPIFAGDDQIGAIGISGGSAEEDLAIARAALG